MRMVVFGVAAIANIFAVSSLSLFAHETKPGTEHQHHSGADHAGATHKPGTTHKHRAVEIPPGQPVPTVNLVVHPDPMNGWNLEVKVTNFTFAPERINTKMARSNEGHAHLYINGQKVARLYSTWYHIPNSSLKPGSNKITVTLNTNSHDDLVFQSKPIQDTEIVQVAVSGR